MMDVIRLEDVARRRETGDVAFELEIPALSIRRGSFTAVVGESGCGKSTLLDLLALVLRPTRSSVFTFACEPGQAEGTADIAALWANEREAQLAALRRRHLGYVLQTGGLLPFLNVRGNLTLPFSLAGERADAAELEAMADRLGIAGQLDKSPARLSGGQRQRAAILRAISRKPSLILADEPTAAVDKPRARAIIADFKALAREHGLTVVMVTHDEDLVRGAADAWVSFETTAVSAHVTRSVCRKDPA